MGVNESSGDEFRTWARGTDNPHHRLVAVRLANAAGLDGVGTFSLYERRMNRLDSLNGEYEARQVPLGRAKIARPRTRCRMQAGAARRIVDGNPDERRARG